MLCPNCQSIIPDDAKFCTSCGTQIAASNPDPVTAPQNTTYASSVDDVMRQANENQAEAAMRAAFGGAQGATQNAYYDPNVAQNPYTQQGYAAPGYAASNAGSYAANTGYATPGYQPYPAAPVQGYVNPNKRSGGLIALNVLIFIIALIALGAFIIVTSIKAYFSTYTSETIVSALPIYSDDYSDVMGTDESLSEAVYEWLDDLSYYSLDNYDITVSDVDDALRAAHVEDFLEDIIDTCMDDFLYQTGEIAELPDMMIDFIEDNQSVLEKELNDFPISGEILDQIRESIEDSDELADLSIEAMLDINGTNPAVAAVRGMTSTATFIVLIVVLLLCLVGIFFTSKKHLGSTLVQTGAICSVHMVISFGIYSLFKGLLESAFDYDDMEAAHLLLDPLLHALLINFIVLLIVVVICFVVGFILKRKAYNKAYKAYQASLPYAMQ